MDRLKDHSLEIMAYPFFTWLHLSFQ